MGFSRQEYWIGLPLPSPCRERAYSYCDVWALIVVASLVPEHWFQSAASVFVAHRHSCLLGSLVAFVSFPDRNQIPLYCIGRWILNHCTTREFLIFLYFMITVFFWDIFYSLCVTLVSAPQSGDSCLLDMRIKKMIFLTISSSLFYVLLFWNTPSHLTLQIGFIVSLFLLFFGGMILVLVICLFACLFCSGLCHVFVSFSYWGLSWNVWRSSFCYSYFKLMFWKVIRRGACMTETHALMTLLKGDWVTLLEAHKSQDYWVFCLDHSVYSEITSSRFLGMGSEKNSTV